MPTVGQRVLEAVRQYPGETDRYLTDVLFGKARHQSQVNQETRHLANRGMIFRKRREDRRWGNYPIETFAPVHQSRGFMGRCTEVLNRCMAKLVRALTRALTSRENLDAIASRNGKFDLKTVRIRPIR